MPNRNQTSGANAGRGNRGGRGFASMDQDKQREIASKGGRAAHQSGNAHEFDTMEAREAGRRGGRARSETRASSRSSDTGDDQSVTQMLDLDEEPGSPRMPGRDDGQSGRKGNSTMRTPGKHRTDTDDKNTSSGRGKHH